VRYFRHFDPRILYPAKLSFKIDRTIKIFHDKQKVKQHMTIKQLLQKTLQGILHTDNESKQNHERMGSIKPQEKRQVIRE
jgi:stress-induced morphogen